MKPILFNTSMVRAILDGEKTCTRRIIKPAPKENTPLGFVLSSTDSKNEGLFAWGKSELGERICYAKLPYKVGDILYIRETWANTWTPEGEVGFVYKADGEPKDFPYWGNAKQVKHEVWMPSIHMPKEAARIFLKVKSVRAERLKDISDEGCYQEGISSTIFYDEAEHIQIAGIGLNDSLERAAFSLLWNSTVKEDKYSWEANPWVWVIEFEVENKGGEINE